jgi:CHAD domain-containing protein/uncharacterized protein YjbK
VSDVREREIKLLAVSAEQLEALGRSPNLGGRSLVPRDEVEQEDVYVDTEDYRLLKAGLSLRHRAREGGGKLTMKEVPSVRGRALLRDRREIEEATDGVDPFTVMPGAVGDRVASLVGRRALEPLVRLRTRRRRFDVGSPVGAELCLDDVQVLPVEGETPITRFYEVEIEDRGLGGDILTAIGGVLRMVHGLQPSELSKFERGLAARGLLAEVRGEEETFDLVVRPEDRSIDAAFKVFRRHFERMKANEVGTRIGEDIEFLHDMRVSTRRLRMAFRTFRPEFGKERLSSFNAALKWIASALGDVRDLDVYLERLPEYAEMLPESERPALEPYRARLEADRVRARKRMLRVLDSRRYERFVARFDAWLRRGAPMRPRRPQARVPVIQAAPRKIRKAVKIVLGRGRAIPDVNPPAQDLHDLRILCKRLRYTCEFFRDLYDKGMRKFVKSVVELQDLLGAHQDACVAGDTLRASADKLRAGKPSVQLALVLGQLIGAQDRSAAASRSGFHAAWKEFDRKRHRRGMWG